MAKLSEDQRIDMLAVSFLVGPMTDSDINSATSRSAKITAAFKMLSQIKTELVSKVKA